MRYLFYGGGGEQLLIIRIEDIRYYDRFAAFLAGMPGLHAGARVFFAVKMSVMLGHNKTKQLSVRLDDLNREMHAAILGSKYDRCQLDFIYY